MRRFNKEDFISLNQEYEFILTIFQARYDKKFNGSGLSIQEEAEFMGAIDLINDRLYNEFVYFASAKQTSVVKEVDKNGVILVSLTRYDTEYNITHDVSNDKISLIKISDPQNIGINLNNIKKTELINLIN